MSPDNRRSISSSNDGSHPDDRSGTSPTPVTGFWRKTWQVLKTVQARLRFFVLLAIIGIVIGSWTTISAYWEKWTRPFLGQEQEASSDIEYFCPMHPFIVRDKPNEKCPICHMDLAKRKKGTGETEPLTPGTVSRLQLTPYRVVLAGVRTSAVESLPLTKQIVTVGTVEFDETRYRHIAAWQKGRIAKQFVNYTGQDIEENEPLAVLDVRFSPELSVTLDDLVRARKKGDRDLEQSARKRLRVFNLDEKQIDELVRGDEVHNQVTIYSPIKGHVTKKFQKEGSFVEEGTPLYDVADLSTVWVEAQVYEADQNLVKKGQQVEATTLGGQGEPPIEGRVSFVYPHLDEASRTLTVRFEFPHNQKPDHSHKLRPGSFATVKIEVPPSEVGVMSEALVQDYTQESALENLLSALSSPAIAVEATGLRSWLTLTGRLAALRQGSVLAVPDSAVIDTGNLKIVYREASPNVFEGVAVHLGPRMTKQGGTLAYYPVLRGLSQGNKVVTNGSFLIDAETRLNPSAGSIYYGGSGSTGGASSVAVRPSTPAALGEVDNRLIEAQKTCPITGNALGSMGLPVKVMIKNQPVFLCCEGCKKQAEADPAGTLKTVEQRKAKTASETHNHP
jgi:Cu(I)/Ag(I) efflux system membrane fusion protein